MPCCLYAHKFLLASWSVNHDWLACLAGRTHNTHAGCQCSPLITERAGGVEMCVHAQQMWQP